MTTNEDPTSQTSTSLETASPEASAQGNPVAEDRPAETTETEKLVQPEPAFGWTAYAEQINGRFAMIGFVLLLILEAVTGQDFFTWLGLR